MPSATIRATTSTVALLAEGVDRNCKNAADCFRYYVALLAEGVDRNTLAVRFGLEVGVALLAEGVDRNIHRESST